MRVSVNITAMIVAPSGCQVSAKPTHGKIDVKHPTPGSRGDDLPANPRAESHANRVDHEDDCHVVAPEAERDKVRDNDVDDDVDAAGANALDGTASDEHGA